MAEIEWTFGSGAAVTITVDTAEKTLTVRCNTGSFDLNAIWLSDGDATKDGSWTLAKSDNSLNMNGTGIVWDDLIKLSSTGLGSAGTAKSTYLTAGEELSFSFSQLVCAGLDCNYLGFSAEQWAALTMGVRVTSASGFDGSKLVDVGGTILNSPPVAVADFGTAGENDNASFDVLANDTDPDAGDTKSLVSLDSIRLTSANDTVNAITDLASAFGITDGKISFTPGNLFDALTRDQTATVIVSYTMRDAAGETASSTLTLTITGTNDAPMVTGAVTGVATEDGAASTLSALANASDVDVGDALEVVGLPATLPAGVSYDAASKSFTLDPTHAAYQSLKAGATATVTVEYAVSDGAASTPTSVSWTITGTNDAPVVTGAVTGVATEDGAASTLSALANASDVDVGDALEVVGLPATLPAGVSYDAASKSFTLDPTHAAYQSLKAGATATVTVEYAVSDGTASTPASVSWTITGTNDAPVVTGAVTGVATEDGAASTLSALANASDVDVGDALEVVGLPATLPAGVSYDAASKSFTLDPTHAAYQSLKAGATATVTVEYAVSDGTASTPASVSWTITGTNDTATIGGDATGEVVEDDAPTASGRLTVSDVDAGEAGFVVTSPLARAYGDFTFDAATGEWSYTLGDAAQALRDGEQKIETLTVTSLDGTASETITVTVTGTSDAAVFSGTRSGLVQEDSSNSTASGKVIVFDPDAGESRFAPLDSTVIQGVYGYFLFDPLTGDWSYTLDNSRDETNRLTAGDAALDTLRLESVDGSSTVLSVTVLGANDAPTATADKLVVSDNTTVTLPWEVFLANDIDPDSILSITAASGASSGLSGLAVNSANKTITFAVGNNVSSDQSFQYTVSDGATAATATVTIKVVQVTNSSNPGDNISLAAFTPYQASFIDARNGNDTITAASVVGGNDRDWLTGGGGDDRLTGGTGNDVFIYAKGGGHDVILDFRAAGAGNDLLDLDVAFSSLKIAATSFESVASTLITSTSWGNNDSLVLKGFTGTIDPSWII